jgi:hypothetical protein
MTEQTADPAPLGEAESRDAPGVTAPATPDAPPAAAGAGPDPLSAMTPRFNLFFRLFANRFFRYFDLDDATVERLRELESRGTVVYVMRYASRLDYFLFNALFRREGLRLSSFANGIFFYYYRPLREALRVIWKRPRGVAQDVELVRNRDYVRGLTGAHQSYFLFLRTASLRSQLRARRRAIEQARTERDLLSEVVGAAWQADRPVHLVPLALFWRKGPRARRRFFNLSYGAATRPSDLAKVTSFLTTYRGLHVKVGDPIDLGGFIETRRADGTAAVARIVRRILLTFLYREERVVEGPVLEPRHRVQEIVVRSAAVQEAIRQRASEKRIAADRARAQAERMFREIAANMNSTFLAVLDFLVGAITRRLFVSIEVSGIEKVTDYAKRNQPPLVLRLHHHLPALLRPSHPPAPHRGARQHGVRPVRLHLAAGRGLLHAPILRRRTLQGGVPHLRLVSHQGGLHPGVLHRGRAFAHRQDAGSATRHAVLGRRGLPHQRPSRPVLRAHRHHLRAPGGGGLDGRRAGRRGEASREHAGSGPRTEVPAAALRERLRQLR